MTPVLDELTHQDRHDLKGAVRTVRFAVEALRTGDRFEGPDGPEQLTALDQAIDTIERVLELRQVAR